jgi:membrane associated rhomboid family serine protease
MGLRDRDYTQRDYNRKKQRPHRSGGRSAVVSLIIINFALWIINGFLFSANNNLTELLLFREDFVLKISECYRLLTYGFVHAPQDWTHIVFNMFGLLMFGYGMMLGIGPGGFGFVRGENVENQLGKLEFITFYLLTILIGGVVFALMNFGDPKAGVLGASGGVCGVIILYAWMFPNKTLLLYGILPMPMWALGMLIVVMDAWGAAGGLGGAVAYTVHLAGAAFGTLFYHLLYKQRLRLTEWCGDFTLPKGKPKVKIHTPKNSASNTSASDEEFNRRLDDILKRYGEVGESGLTAEEREFLQRASRKFAEKYRK